MHPISFRAAAGVLATAVLASACATGPIVEWAAPAPPASPSHTLDHALATLGAARHEYDRVLREQTSGSQRLGNALIVGGALATGLAVGQAHSDAILGVGLLGGTAYALGGYNIDQRRWLIYQSALESFDCARKAAEPANMRLTEREGLAKALESTAVVLASAELNLSVARGQVEAEGNVNRTKAELAQPLKAQLKALEPTIAAAKASVAQGQSLLNAVDRTPDRLIAAVKDIDNSARRALLSTIPDRNAALAAIADVAKGAAAVTPGAGTDTRFKDSLEAYNRNKPQSLTDSSSLKAEVQQSVKAAEAEVQALATQIAVIDNLVERHKEALQRQSLAACQLGELAALSIAPMTLTLAANDAPAFVLIQGGKAPYAAQASVGSSSIALQGPVRNDTHFTVSLGASSAAGKQYQVLVLDSSTPPQTALLTVVREQEGGEPARQQPALTNPSRPSSTAPRAPTNPVSTSGAATPGAPGAGASGAAPSLQSSVDAMGPFTMPDTSRISLGGATQVDAAGKLRITLDCRRPESPPPACIPPADLRSGVKQALAGRVDPPVIDAATLVTRPASCVCPA